MKMSIMATVGLSLMWIESGMPLNFSCWLTAEATGKTKACARVVTRYRLQLRHGTDFVSRLRWRSEVRPAAL